MTKHEDDINVLALVKGEERYVFLYTDRNRPDVLRQLGRYAANPELNFTWYDAAVLSQRVRKGDEPLYQAPPTISSRSARDELP